VKVTLLACTVSCLDQLPSPASLIEFAGRVCTNTVEKLGADSTHFIQARLAEGHESLIEHGHATFLISGVSRVTSHQLVRSRLCSFSQQSQRSVSQTASEVILPPSIAKLGESACSIFREQVLSAKRAYQQLRDLGVSKEDARYLLPEGICTELVMSANFRSWHLFLKQRLAKAAQWEIRGVAGLILQELVDICPEVFANLT
jgi:thymidylate synthase (FAD)